MKKDRTATLSRAPHLGDFVHQDVIPMPGRLAVDYYDWDLHLGFSVPLNEVTAGTLVTATGTIAAVVRLSGGRAMAVITTADGNSAHVLLNADIVRMVTPALYRGNRLNVRGTVTRTTVSQPAGIVAGGVNVEIV
ncbi:hypothetical protein [Streptomyces sp. LUP47B]|uniref:hypothetical protein n=2 Tax=unclassified Streptomyces TaxID=2593676 RepID=UPI000851F73D|nr:hypothetical protein [Streptomyces sp. LUP47B]